MSSQWVICLAAPDAASLAPLRLTRGIEVAEKEPFVWVRGTSNEDELDPVLRSLPAVARYELSSGTRLRNLESRIPSENLPALNWQALNTWLRVQLEETETTARTQTRAPGDRRPEANGLHPVPLRVVRSAEERPLDLLVTSIAEWREFAANAPEVRLRQLRFAVNAIGDVVVRGKPLPPLPGRQFVLHGNVAVQAGFAWEPAVSAEVLARRLGLSADALVLLHEDATFFRIEAEQFVPATRSAVRETSQGFGTP